MKQQLNASMIEGKKAVSATGLNISHQMTMQASTYCDGSNRDESLINKSIDDIMQPCVI